MNRVDFLYADWHPDTGLEWREEWNAENERFEVPLAIYAAVYWDDGRQESWLRRTAGSGQFERLGNWEPRKD